MQTSIKTVDEILVEVRYGDHTIADFDARAEEHTQQLMTDVLKRLGYYGHFWLRLGRVVSRSSKHKGEVTVLRPCPPSSVLLQINLREVADGLVFEAWLEVPDEIQSELFYEELAEILNPDYERKVATHVRTTPMINLPGQLIVRLQEELTRALRESRPYQAQLSDEVAIFLVGLIYSRNPVPQVTFTQKEIRSLLAGMLRLRGKTANTVPRWYFDRLLAGGWVTRVRGKNGDRYTLTPKAMRTLESKVAEGIQGATLTEFTERTMDGNHDSVDNLCDILPPDERIEEIEHIIACAEAERLTVLREEQKRQTEVTKHQKRVEEIRRRMQELEQVLNFQEEELDRLKGEYESCALEDRLDGLVSQIGRFRHRRRQLLQSSRAN